MSARGHGSPGRLGTFVLCGLLFAVAQRTEAQADSCLRRTVLASVLTQTGEPVANVSASSFRGTIHGKPVRILSATRDLSPKRVVVLLQSSASMVNGDPRGPRGKWEFALRAFANIASDLPPEDEIALLVFATKVDFTVLFGVERRVILEKIAELKAARKGFPNGSTRIALLDTILAALKLLEPRRAGDVIYVITDGFDSASRADPLKVEEALVAAGVRVFALGLVGVALERLVTPNESRGADLLRNITGATGGVFLPIEKYTLADEQAAALSLRLLRLYSQMTAPYRLEIELPGPVEKRTKWELEMVDENGKKSRLWSAAYQKILLPCQRPAAQK